jgi:hypothetical protein
MPFAYKRPWHTRQTVEALQKNELAADSDLFIYSDAPKDEDAALGVREVRECIRAVNGFRSIRIIERKQNHGLARSIISGVSEVVAQFGRIIVLEDDMVTSPWFLRYMNDALEFYRDEERVISIHGYCYPVRAKLPETFFLRGADCWGWATWQRGWELFEPDGKKLLDELRERGLTHKFDFDGAYGYTADLENQVNGVIDSWAIRWYASAFLRDKITLYPNKSLIHNIGIDESGTHCEATDKYDTDISREAVRVEKIFLEENTAARRAFRRFFRSLQPTLRQRVLARINRITGRIL